MSQKQIKISPEEYREILEGIQLDELNLVKLTSELDQDHLSSELTVDYEVKKPSYKAKQGGFHKLQ
jgi:hypothetical protein